MQLQKIISGAQTGADEAGLFVAKRFGFATGGTIPKGFRTLAGPRPEFTTMYGIVEHTSDSYVPRTYQNVRDADGTIRLAGNFSSPGEVCTLKAIIQYNKPHFDVDLSDPPPFTDFCAWLSRKEIKVLNVAGNAEQTYSGSFKKSVRFLTDTFFAMGRSMTVTEKEIVEAFGLDSESIVCFNNAGLMLKFMQSSNLWKEKEQT